jgi:hypothetical protein
LYASYQEDLRKASLVKIESFLAELWWCNGCVHCCWGTQWSFWHWSIEMGEDLKNNACNEYKTQIYVYMSTDGTPDNLGSFLWLSYDCWMTDISKKLVFLTNFVSIYDSYDSPTSTFVTDVFCQDASIGGSFFWLWSLLTELWPNKCFVRWIRRFWPFLGHNFAKIDDNHKILFWTDVFC